MNHYIYIKNNMERINLPKRTANNVSYISEQTFFIDPHSVSTHWNHITIKILDLYSNTIYENIFNKNIFLAYRITL